MTNKEFTTRFQQYLIDNKFTIKNIQYLNGYFIFESGEDNVIHFEIKECRGWKFGIWLVADDDNEVIKYTLFARHKDDLDKFKPSRSHKLLQISSEIKDEETEDWIFYDVDKMLNYIHNHPIIAYLQDYGGYTYLPKNILLTYIKEKFYAKKYLFGNWYRESSKYNLTYIKLCMVKKYLSLKKINDFISNVEVVDNNNNNEWIATPRYNLHIEILQPSQDVINYKIRPIVLPFYHINGKTKKFDNCDIIWHTKGANKHIYGFILMPTEEDMYNVYGVLYKWFKNPKYDKYLYNDNDERK